MIDTHLHNAEQNIQNTFNILDDIETDRVGYKMDVSSIEKALFNAEQMQGSIQEALVPGYYSILSAHADGKKAKQKESLARSLKLGKELRGVFTKIRAVESKHLFHDASQVRKGKIALKKLNNTLLKISKEAQLQAIEITQISAKKAEVKELKKASKPILNFVKDFPRFLIK